VASLGGVGNNIKAVVCTAIEGLVQRGDMPQDEVVSSRICVAVPEFGPYRWALTRNQMDSIHQKLASVHALPELLAADEKTLREWLASCLPSLSEAAVFSSKNDNFVRLVDRIIRGCHGRTWHLLDDVQLRTVSKLLLSAHPAGDVLVSGLNGGKEVAAWALETLPTLQGDEQGPFHAPICASQVRYHMLCEVRGSFVGKGAGKLNQEQAAAVAERLAKVHSIFDILSRPDIRVANVNSSTAEWVRDAVSHLCTEGHKAFQCPICFDASDPFEAKVQMWCPRAKSNENWTKRPCEHSFCRDCMKTWCETGISSMQHHIHCPAEGCSYTLWKDDVRGLVSPGMFKAFEKNRNANYKKHLKEMLKEEDPEIKKWLRKHARPCPSCSVIVSRESGCDDMRCVCGCSFCYYCGRKNCKCGKKKANIWDIAERKLS